MARKKAYKLPKKGRRKNTTKNARAGKRFVTSKNKKGQTVHTYNIKGKKVSVVVGKGKGKSIKPKKKRVYKRKAVGMTGGGQFTK